MQQILIQSITLGFLFIIGTDCQDYMTLNMPSRSPYLFSPVEELAMDVSEVQPVFYYASSQNEFSHQNLPEHAISTGFSRQHQHQRPHQHQHQQQRQQSVARPTFANSPSHISQNQRNNKPRTTPQLTYGFTPKLSSKSPVNNHPVQQKSQPNQYTIQQNDRPRGGRPQEPVYQASVKHGIQHSQHQSKKFTENIQVQSTVHQSRPHTTSSGSSSSYQNDFADLKEPLQYLSHILSQAKPFSSPTPSYRRPVSNVQGYQNTNGGNQKFIPHGNNRDHQPKEEHKQESVRKHVTFDNAAQSFHDRYNNRHVTGENFPVKVSNNQNGQRASERNQNNERMNMQTHARSMRGHNIQLPPRPAFSNGGVQINTFAGELPVLPDSFSTLNARPPAHKENNNHGNHRKADEQEKKTYLLIKAPPLTTTESPLSTLFQAENVRQTSPPYIINDYPQTTFHSPEILHSTLPEPRALEETAQTPAVVLDLVQVPDLGLYNHHQEKKFSTDPQPEYRSAVKELDHEENFHPTESYPTTPMHAYDDILHHLNNVYSSLPEENDVVYPPKVLPKPKIKDAKKSSNFTLLQPISYSSSVSVVSVKQNVDHKQPTVKKQKAAVKKALSSSKKKNKFQDYDYNSYDDYDYGQNVPGDPGVDYPTYKNIPETKFDCSSMVSPGFYADTDTGCQVFHNCDTAMTKHSFMCPNGTIFHQELFICDWWYNVKCEDSPEFYTLNSGTFNVDNAHGESRRKA